MNIFLLLAFLNPVQIRPTSDVLAFLAQDQTDKMVYNYQTFNCVQFSDMLFYHATQAGFMVSEVSVYIPEIHDGHRFVAFATTDGIVWIEPQNDGRYRVFNPNDGIQEGEDGLCYWNGECIYHDIGIPVYEIP